MGSQKTSYSLKEASDSRFATKEWNIINDQSNACYAIGNYL